MQNYGTPMIEIIYFETEDIVTSSDNAEWEI